MGIQISRLVAAPDLGLRVVVDAPDAREIEWAHVSELAAPGQWLTGGELLLTTGLQLTDDADQAREYCRSLQEAGVAALGISVGESLSHRTIPDALVAAARRTALPLLEVPLATPLERIVRTVAHMLELERTERLRRAFRAQGALTASAISPGGLDGVLTSLASATRTWGVVCDRWGAVLAATVDDAESRVAGLRPHLDTVGGLPPTVSLLGDDDSSRLTVQPLGVDGNARGLLVAGKDTPFDSFDRILVASAVSLLSLELEHRHRAEQASWRDGAQLLGWLARGAVTEAEAAARLRRYDLDLVDATAFVVEPCGQDPRALRQLLAQELVPRVRSLLLDEHRGLVRGLVLEPLGDLRDRLAALTPGMHVGIGQVVPIHVAALSLQQASRALAVASTRGEHVVVLAELSSFRAVVELGDRSALRAMADSILTPLDVYDAGLDEPVLVPTLREYLGESGTAEATAEALGVHRHTVRQRLQRINEISGLDPHNANDRFELLLAVRIRDLVDA